MMNRSLIDKAASPRQKYIFIGMLVAALMVMLAMSFEFGQSRAGFNRIEALRNAVAYTDELDANLAELNSLRSHIAILETAAQIDKETYGLVERQLLDLQSQISELEENLEFYRGIVSPDDSKGVQIQELRITTADAPNHYRLQLFLTQALRSDRPISGVLNMRILGQIGSVSSELQLAELLSDKGLKTPDKFRFRYFQEVLAEILLPEGFEPSSVEISARPAGKKSKTVEESFVWQLNAG
jgi:hypothetical protein